MAVTVSFDVVSELLSPRDYKETIERVTGKRVILLEITLEIFDSSEFKHKIGKSYG